MKRAGICGPFLALIVLLLSWLTPAPLLADAGDPPARVARLSYLKGNVSLQPSGANDWSQATVNYPLTTGDRVYTDQGSQAELEIGSTAVRLSEATDLTVANLSDQVMQLGLGQGTIRVRVYELAPGESVEVDTPNGALALLQPGDYRVDTFPDQGATLVTVNRGSLEVSGGGVLQRVESGGAVKLTGSEQIQVSSVEPPHPDAFDQWCQERDRSFESSASTRYVGRGVPGYHDLDEYGRWQENREYGPVWYPTAVPAGWVPYRYGHWVWIEPWGWTWVEDEAWGFCPFHYGRWLLVGAAWGWVPGPVVVRPYYAPALVAFVGGPGFSIGISVGGGVGWFPLGPRESYFPWYHHGDTYLRQVNVTDIRNVTNITNITNVTNINNIRYANRTAATTVVATDTFRGGQPVARQVLHVSPDQLGQAQIIPHPRVAATGNALIGGRPAPIPPRVLRPVTIPATGERPAPSRPNQPPVTTRNAPPARGEAGQPPPRFVTRRPLPAPTPPLPARQQAMEEHPGRPLEPQQIENLRAGKPAGSMRDREFPPHPSEPQSRKAGRSGQRSEKPAPKSSEPRAKPHRK
jgi:hypothetical protein